MRPGTEGLFQALQTVQGKRDSERESGAHSDSLCSPRARLGEAGLPGSQSAAQREQLGRELWVGRLQWEPSRCAGTMPSSSARLS